MGFWLIIPPDVYAIRARRSAERAMKDQKERMARGMPLAKLPAAFKCGPWKWKLQPTHEYVGFDTPSQTWLAVPRVEWIK